MKLVSQDLIEVRPGRFRTDCPTDDLEKSIETHGLMHPPVIDSEGRLIAGARRLAAMKKLHSEGRQFKFLDQIVPPGMIPVASFEEMLDELKRKELEWAENEDRLELSWQDKAKALATLHELRQLQNPDWTLKDTAQEAHRLLGTSQRQDKAIQMLTLASMLDDKQVASASSMQEALRIARQKVEADLAKALTARTTTSPRFILGDIADVWPRDVDFSVIIADPPYGIDMDKAMLHTSGIRCARGTSAEPYEDTFERTKHIVEFIANLQTEAHVYVFCDFRRWADICKIFDAAGGWRVHPRPIIFAKDRGYHPWLSDAPGKFYECIVFARRTNRGLKMQVKDVIYGQVPIDTIVEAQKPVGVYETLLNWSAIPGSKVIDPCAGSGTIFRAARNLAIGIEAWGIELDSTTYSAALARLKHEGVL